jgi:hypothetical protein
VLSRVAAAPSGILNKVSHMMNRGNTSNQKIRFYVIIPTRADIDPSGGLYHDHLPIRFVKSDGVVPRTHARHMYMIFYPSRTANRHGSREKVHRFTGQNLVVSCSTILWLNAGCGLTIGSSGMNIGTYCFDNFVFLGFS